MTHPSKSLPKLLLMSSLLSGCVAPKPGTKMRANAHRPVPAPLTEESSAASLDHGVPAGMLSFFASEACPEGWREVEQARGRALLATTKPQRVGHVSAGPPPPPRMAPVHEHRGLSVTTQVPEKSYFTGASGCSNTEPFAAAAIPAAGDTKPFESNLPFVHQRLCEKLPPAKTDHLPYGSYGLFNAQTCPAGWTRADECEACPDLDGRFILPLRDGARIARTVGRPWLDGEPAAHTHEVEGSVTPADGGLLAVTGTNYRAARGELSYSGKTGEPDHHPLPSIEYLACVKTELSDEGRLPANLTIFYGGEDSCPRGWTTTGGTGGRFIVASPEGRHDRVTFGGVAPLEDGEDRTHVHAYFGNFVIPGDPVCLNGGTWPIAQSGHYSFRGATKPASSGVPYVQLRQCTYTRSN